MAEPQGSEGAEPVATEGEEPAGETVPEGLTLLHFFGRDELCDCAVRLPTEGEEGKEVKCHRLLLCSCSGYFYRKFILEGVEASSGGSLPVVDVPTLPEDRELRRQIDVHALMPLLLRYAYASQKWEALDGLVTADNATGLYVFAALLEAEFLAKAAMEHLEATGLSPQTATRLLYLAMQLQATGGDVFRDAFERCSESVRLGFGQALQSPVEAELLCKLPVSLLGTMLQADDLEVSSEGSVLQVVRRVLWRRMAREDRSLSVVGGKLCDAGHLLEQSVDAATVVWQLSVLEESPETPAADPGPAEVAKYTVRSAVSPFAESAPSEGVPIQDLSLRFPVRSLGPKRSGCLLLQAKDAGTSFIKKNDGEVLLAALLPVNLLPEPGQESGEEDLSVDAHSPDGQPAGTIRFKWNVEPAPPVPDATETAEGEATAEGESPPSSEDFVPDAPVTAEDVDRLLSAVRFAYLEHKDLLAASKDPVLLEAGAQQQVLAALSSRLSQYETAGVENEEEGAVPPRPATLRDPQAPPVAHEQPIAQEDAPQPPSETPYTGRGAVGGSGALPGASAGHPLFACMACDGKGKLQLRQHGVRWCARCSRHSSCQHVIWLPSCIMAAAVDGHCAQCALRLGSEVRTLTVRVGREHLGALQKLPGGVDTLRGMCIAGCNDTLSLLGG